MRTHRLVIFIVLGTMALTTGGHAQNVQPAVQSSANRLSESLEIHGFISQGWMLSSDNNWLVESDDGSFDFREVGLSFMGEMSNELRVGIQLVSRQLGYLEEGGVVVDWAYVDYYAHQFFGARIGRTKTPIGLYGDSRDFDVLRTFVLMPQGVYNEILRDQAVAVNGTSFYGNISSKSLGNLNYTTWIGGMPFNSTGGMIQWVEEYADNFYDIDRGTVDYVTGLNLRWETPLDGLLVSGTAVRLHGLEFSGATSAVLNAINPLIPIGVPTLIEVDHADVVTYGIEYTQGPLTCATEYMTYRAKAESTITGIAQQEDSIYWEGYYASLTYQMTDALSLGLYYSLFYDDAGDKNGTELEATGRNDWEGWQKDLAMGVRYDFTENLSLKGEVHQINGTAMLSSKQNQAPYEEDWYLYSLKLSYSF